MKRVFLIAIIIFLPPFRINTPIFAQTVSEKTLIINEFMPNPVGVDSDYEWIEMVNVSKIDIDLSTMLINNTSVVDTEYLITPGTYFVLARNKEMILSRYPDLENVIQTSFSLTNASGAIEIQDVNFNIIDSASYSNSIEGRSFERAGFLYEECLDFYVNQEGNTIGTTNYYYDSYCWGEGTFVPGIEISEISINPEGEDVGNEFITFHTTDNFINADLQNYELRINNYELFLDEHCLIGGSGECILTFDELTLHNDFGLIELVYDGSVLQSFSYDYEIMDGQLVSYVNDEFVLSDVRNLDLSSIEFSEIYPSPDTSEQEWLEVFNNSSEEIYLDNLTIHRDSCETEKISDDFTNLLIKTNEYLVIDESFLNKALLNSGGTLVLCDNTNLIDKLTYPSINKLESFAYSGSIFEVTSITTPGESNQFPEIVVEEPEPSQEEVAFELEIIPILEAKSLEKGAEVKVSGYVIFSNRNDSELIYLSDKESGIWIDLSNNFIDPFDLGRKVEIVGITSEEHGEKKIRASEIKILGQETEIEATKIDKLSEEYVGSYVETESTVISKYSKGFDLENGLRVSEKYVEVEIDRGDLVNIKGILGFDKDKFVLYPFGKDQLLIINNQEIDEGEVLGEDELISNDVMPESRQELQIANGEKMHNSNIEYRDLKKVDIETLSASSSSTEKEEIFQLPIMEKHEGDFITLKSGFILPEFFQFQFLLFIIILLILLLIINRRLILEKVLKVVNGLREFEIPEEYFKRR